MKRKFTRTQILEIRERHATGQTLEQIADWYYFHTTTVWKIVTRQSYREVT